MDQNRGEIAFSLHTKIADNEMKRRELLAENGKILSEMFEQKYYQDILGDENGEWAGYLGQLELYYTRGRVHNLIMMLKGLEGKLGVLYKDFADISESRLLDIVSVANVDTVSDWLIKARTLTSRDWTIEIRKAKGLITLEDEHNHDYVVYQICKKCGEKHKNESNS